MLAESNPQQTPFEHLLSLISERSVPQTLIVTESRLEGEQLRRRIQTETTGFAPRIIPIAEWIHNIGLLHLTAANRPNLLLGRQERMLFLPHWLKTHSNTSFRRYANAAGVRAINTLLEDLYLAGRSIREFVEAARSHQPGGEAAQSPFPALMTALAQEFQARKWLNREQLPQTVAAIHPALLKAKQVILYQCQKEHGYQQNFIAFLKDQLRNTSVNIVDIPAGGPFSDSEAADQLAGASEIFFRADFHDQRAELMEIFRRIRIQVAKDEAAFSDHIVLLGDGHTYQPFLESAARTAEVPVYSTLSARLAANPLVRRFQDYLSLGLGGFQIDHIQAVFGDNLFELPSGLVQDEYEAPNVRSFSRFCRKYNLRTLTEASSGIEGIERFRLKQIVDDSPGRDEQQIEREQAQAKREFAFYRNLIEVLAGLKTLFKLP